MDLTPLPLLFYYMHVEETALEDGDRLPTDRVTPTGVLLSYTTQHDATRLSVPRPQLGLCVHSRILNIEMETMRKEA